MVKIDGKILTFHLCQLICCDHFGGYKINILKIFSKKLKAVSLVDHYPYFVHLLPQVKQMDANKHGNGLGTICPL